MCEKCVHRPVCSRYAAMGGYVSRCQHYLEEISREPLTEAELRAMCGEPVWIQDDVNYENTGWVVWTRDHVRWMLDKIGSAYGDLWRAYRQKPERRSV